MFRFEESIRYSIFYIVTYYIKWVTTSWTYDTPYTEEMFQNKVVSLESRIFMIKLIKIYIKEIPEVFNFDFSGFAGGNKSYKNTR